MIGKVLPVLFLIGGLAAGSGAGLFLGLPDGSRGAVAQKDHAQEPDQNEMPSETDTKHGGNPELEYHNLTKQFVIPVVKRDRISALVTLSLGLETPAGMGEALYSAEPKLRDEFLQVLFDHANMGGFDGAFTQSDRLDTLRQALLDVARQVLGDDISRVLILSIARQDS
ncbi:flagellar basal body-associated protein FliL [Ruegeria marisrubri]|uniref:Flagellar basal body-associated protein FliL n=1 Tax=Ruegeria marisrubri TaxID=1685379 RepID=A0A0X3TQF3_9RHOB|nr:flagellar basal body-associated protein FliL [Ruegeria marisrubri]KUJ77964.1 flagellar basal body-associated protein FliL [Ruegeria marisrubri]